MIDGFENVIAQLWGSLGLATPEYAADGSALLTVDGLKVKLAAATDGRHIVVSCRAGEFSSHRALMDDQAEAILKANLCWLTVNRACVCFEREGSGPPVLIVQALAACNAAFMDRLVETIGDVAALASERARLLVPHGAQISQAAVKEEFYSDALVFRP
jgi:Tir chaperone protein (CesT) family